MRKLLAVTVLIVLIVASIGLAHPNQQRFPRPNIIFILVDDLRGDELSIAGHPFLKTPRIDRIGREGALFRNAFMTTPLCSPSRASFLTGNYAHTHGITDNVDRFNEEGRVYYSRLELLAKLVLKAVAISNRKHH